MPGNFIRKFITQKLMEISIYTCDLLIITTQVLYNIRTDLISYFKKYLLTFSSSFETLVSSKFLTLSLLPPERTLASSAAEPRAYLLSALLLRGRPSPLKFLLGPPLLNGRSRQFSLLPGPKSLYLH